MGQVQSQGAAQRRGGRGVGLVIALVAGDVLAFLAFAALGRRSHNEAAGLADIVAVAATAAPFILGWLVAAPLARAYRMDDARRMAGSGQASATARTPPVVAMVGRTALAWLVAWPLGLLLRALFLQRAIPLSFAIVTFATNLVLLCGWRAVFAWALERRREA